MSRAAIDHGLGELKALLLPRLGRRATLQVAQNLTRMLEQPGLGVDLVLQTIAQTRQAFASRPPEASPLDRPRTIAQVEASPRKLSHLDWRLDRAAPLRGLETAEAEAIGTHADALIPAFGAEDAEHCASLALANVLGFGRQLILGECWSRNDPTPRLLLAEAAAPYVGQEDAAPVALLRDQGVVLAVGHALPSGLARRWVPHTFIYRGRDGVLLDLGQVADTKRFLAHWAPKVRPETLGGILWAALAPFPFDSTVVLAEPGLVGSWVKAEARLEDERAQGHAASGLLGLGPEAPPEEREELSFRVEPAGAEVRYRPGELSVR